MDMKISAKLSIKLAMDIPLDIEGSGRYQTDKDVSKSRHSFILSFSQTSHVEEIPKERYINKSLEVAQNPILSAALHDEAATHVITYIEFGSQLDIELYYEGLV